MRHIVRLGVRGVLLEVSAAVLRVHGAFHYRRLLRQRRERQALTLPRFDGAKTGA